MESLATALLLNETNGFSSVLDNKSRILVKLRESQKLIVSIIWGQAKRIVFRKEKEVPELEVSKYLGEYSSIPETKPDDKVRISEYN